MIQITPPRQESGEAQRRELETFFEIAASILARVAQAEPAPKTESADSLHESEITFEPVAA